jgi:predicted transcriptional regulator
MLRMEIRPRLRTRRRDERLGMTTLSANQDVIYRYLQFVCDAENPLPSIAEISTHCNLSYPQAARAVQQLCADGIVKKHKSDYCKTQVFWLSINDLEYTVSYHREPSERVEVVRTYRQAREYGY